MPIYTKRRVNKDGTVKVYQYEKSSSEYSKRTYNKQKELNPKIECSSCSELVFPKRMDEHRKTNKCKKRSFAIIKEASKETDLINSTQINL